MAPCVLPCLRGRLRGGEADSVEVEDILEVDLAVAVKSIIGGGTAATGTTTATAAEGDPSPPIEPPRDAICSFCRASRKNASLEVSTSPLSSPPLALAPNKEEEDDEEEDEEEEEEEDDEEDEEDEEGVDCRAPPCCPPH